MRVLEFFGEPILFGGQEKFVGNLIKYNPYSDVIIDALTAYNCENTGFSALVRQHGGILNCFNLQFQPGKDRSGFIKPLKEFLDNNRYEVIHIHSGSISVFAFASAVAKIAGIKRIIVHSHSTGISSIKHSGIKLLFAPVLKLCPTDYLACSYEAGMFAFPSCLSDQLKVIRNGILLEKFVFNPELRRQLRRKMNIPDDCMVIGHVGRFSGEKNHAFLIDVFDELHKIVKNCKLLLVGDGELREEIEMKAHNLGLDDAIIFTGNVDEVSGLYQIMDCFVLPSVYEGFSYVALEAQAMGLPCIISSAVPNAAVFNQNVNKLDISESDKWAEWIVNNWQNRIIDDNAVFGAGYDVRDTAKQVCDLYLC